MFGGIGPLEIGIVLAIALLVFGPKKLPELGHGLGRGMREFKDGISGDGNDRSDRPKVVAKPIEAPDVDSPHRASQASPPDPNS